MVDIAANVRLSWWGELEITDVNNAYLEQRRLSVERLGRDYTWLDTSTYESFLDVAAFMHTMELRQGLKIGCPEEVALRLGYIDEKKILRLADALDGNGYGRCLRDLVERRKG